MRLNELQEQVREWSIKNFPNGLPYQPLLGVTEEVGELCHAHLKQEQGIRGDYSQHYEDKVDAVGDIIIYLADYCCRNDINLGAAVAKTWAKVGKRDWQADPVGGGESDNVCPECGLSACWCDMLACASCGRGLNEAHSDTCPLGPAGHIEEDEVCPE